MPREILASFKIVTPMFLGDADQKATGIRPPSIKGALRFWWRALNWGRFVQQFPSDHAEALKAMHIKEASLFGAAADDTFSGQARVSLQIDSTDLKPLQANALGQKFPLGPWRPYLLGQGLTKYDKNTKGFVYQRNALATGNFTLRLTFQPESNTWRGTQREEDIESAEKALLLFGLLGGLGSRARRGLGSVAIHVLTGSQFSAPENLTEWQASLKAAIGGLTGVPAPPYTAFSADTRMDISAQGNNPWMLLADVAKEMQLYRSNGRVNPSTGSREVNGIPLVPPLRFWPDHDIALDIALNTARPNHPERAVFGLPHNYFFSGNNAHVRMEPNTEGRTRRASPLLIHFHEFQDGSACAVQSLFPATFLAATDTIAMRRKQGNAWPTVSTVPAAVNWSVITNYLDRFPRPPRVTVL